MSPQERGALIGKVAADYGIKLDPDDPQLMVVDMCVAVLDARLAKVTAAQPSAMPPNPRELANALAEALGPRVVQPLQAVVKTELASALAKLQPSSVWTHPAFIGVLAALAGVVVGVLLARL